MGTRDSPGCGTMKDELYIYNRTLTAAEIQRNKEKVKK